jgi:hypothetical protein
VIGFVGECAGSCIVSYIHKFRANLQNHFHISPNKPPPSRVISVNTMSFMDRHDSGNSPDMAVMRPDQASAESPRWETIEELFAALEAPLLSYGLRLTGETGLAEDVVQEAFMKLHSQFKEVREPRRWLYRTVHNLALNQRRQAQKSFRSTHLRK